MEEYADTVYGQWVIFEHTDVRQVDQELWAEHTAGRDPFAPENAETVKELEATRSLAESTVTERLRYLIEECPDFPLKDECMLRLARTVPDEASRRAQYKALLRDFPDSPAAHSAAEALVEAGSE